MHAFTRAASGATTVTQLEADLEARKASVRNFGLVWVSGRAPRRRSSTLALRARELWEEIAPQVPGVGFRPDGSLTVAQHPAELAVLEAVARRARGRRARGFRMLEPAEVPDGEPGGPRVECSARCTAPATRSSSRAGCCPALRAAMTERGRLHVRRRPHRDRRPSRVACATTPARSGAPTSTILCPGAAHAGVAAPWLADAPLRRCRLQMMQTAPLGERLTTVARRRRLAALLPGVRGPRGGGAARPRRRSARRGARSCSIAQRAGGELTIGDTHVYDEPYDFAVEDEPYAHLRARAESILGRPLPPVQRRWAGVYSQATDDVGVRAGHARTRAS